MARIEPLTPNPANLYSSPYSPSKMCSSSRTRTTLECIPSVLGLQQGNQAKSLNILSEGPDRRRWRMENSGDVLFTGIASLVQLSLHSGPGTNASPSTQEKSAILSILGGTDQAFASTR